MSEGFESLTEEEFESLTDEEKRARIETNIASLFVVRDILIDKGIITGEEYLDYIKKQLGERADKVMKVLGIEQ